MQFRSGGAAVRGESGARNLPDGRAGRGGAARLRRAEGSDDRRAALSGSRARKRAVLAQPRPGEPVPDSDRRTTSGSCSPIRTGTGRRSTSPIRRATRPSTKAEAKFAPILNATNPDLREFRQRGGKLLQYHGWSDQLIAPQNSIDYYESVAVVLRAAGRIEPRVRDVQSFYRLFMAPGWRIAAAAPDRTRSTCRPRSEQWVEHGIAPEADRRDAFHQRRRRSLASALSVSAGRASTKGRAIRTTPRVFLAAIRSDRTVATFVIKARKPLACIPSS